MCCNVTLTYIVYHMTYYDLQHLEVQCGHVNDEQHDQKAFNGYQQIAPGLRLVTWLVDKRLLLVVVDIYRGYIIYNRYYRPIE